MRWSRPRPAMLVPAALAVVGLLSAPAPASAACEADYCTTVKTTKAGVYALVIPGGVLRIAYPTLAECRWDVEAVYGDGTEPGQYVFSEAAGIAAAHAYPAPGTYVFHAYATNGVKEGTAEPCPSLHIEATVIYPEPEPEEPPPEEPEEEGPAAPGVAAPGPPVSGLGHAPAVGQPPRAPYWRRCGAELRVHRVACGLARRVIRRASASLDRLSAGFSGRLPGRIAGFECRSRRPPSPELACRRGEKRILAPAR